MISRFVHCRHQARDLLPHLKQDLDQFGRYVDTFKHLFALWVGHIGLNYNTFAVLYSLGTAESGYCTQKAIVAEWLIPKQTVFNVCKQFQAQGWIALAESPTDKRERILRLTEQGRVKADEVLSHWATLDQRVFQAFNQAEREQLFASLNGFMQVLHTEVNQLMGESG